MLYPLLRGGGGANCELPLVVLLFRASGTALNEVGHQPPIIILKHEAPLENLEPETKG